MTATGHHHPAVALPVCPAPASARPPEAVRRAPTAERTSLEAEIARRFASGDPEALSDAYRQWGSLVYTLALRALGDPQEAEDATQHVFLSAWRGRAGYRGERGPLAAWLVGITRHTVADALAARSRRADLARTAVAQSEEALRRHHDDESDTALNRVLVLQKLAHLSSVQRRLLGLAIWGDMTQAQIAEETGLPLGTVKSHIRRALHVLRRVMEPPPSRA
ncbi:RNA polymerase sigma factor [Streptomyces sp. NPDC050504]|uniref:RNA polymerase sigma factor n=1 Tax=Streptomyces sp. NPDC050504 TaxID=3365618 RepID=UPI00378F0D74